MDRLILLVVLLVGCTTHEVRYAPVQCTDFEEQNLPGVTEEELDKAGSAAKRRILLRDKMREQRIEQYEQMCKRFKELADAAEND